MSTFARIRPAILPVLAAVSLAVTGCDKPDTGAIKPEGPPAPLFKDQLKTGNFVFKKATIGVDAQTLLGALNKAGSPNAHNELAAAYAGFSTFAVIQGGDWTKLKFISDGISTDSGDTIVRFAGLDTLNSGQELNNVYIQAQRQPEDTRLAAANAQIAEAFKLQQIKELRNSSSELNQAIEVQREKIEDIIGPVTTVKVKSGQTFSKIIESKLPASFKDKYDASSRIALIKAITAVSGSYNSEDFNPVKINAGETIKIPSLVKLGDYLNRNPRSAVDNLILALYEYADNLKHQKNMNETLSTLANH